MTKASDIRLDGRVAIVTGAGNGIGRCMAQALVRAGADVVFADLDVAAAGKAVAEVAFKPDCGKALAVPCDITIKADCERTVNETLRLFGSLHVLVNNAGKGPLYVENAPKTKSLKFWEADADAWAKVIETNVVGTFFMSQCATPYLLRNKWGRIVNVTTSLSTMQRKENSPYGVSKTAIEAETLIWAQDLEGSGVTCNSLIPGGAVNTNFVSAEGKAQATLSGRPLLEADVMIAPILWLASNMADEINGKRYVGKFWTPDMTIEDGVNAALEAPVLLPPDRA
jgi:NAD(P)-dependent dehydrogenase (short-subunit alcohol dehydrogenase family)